MCCFDLGFFSHLIQDQPREDQPRDVFDFAEDEERSMVSVWEVKIRKANIFYHI